MLFYEIKKVFVRKGSQAALGILVVLLGIACYFAANIYYVNENGDREYGPAAVSRLKEAQREWAGVLDEEKLRQVIAENRRIRQSPEARSANTRENNIAYSRGQGIYEIRSLLNCSFGSGFREYDAYRADSLPDPAAADFYENRAALLTEWLNGDASDLFSQKEKEYLTGQYQSIHTPFTYDYMKGWTQFFEFSPTFVMLTMLALGYLVSGIFAGESAWKTDAVLFSTVHGRNRAVLAKLGAGFLIVTGVYLVVMLACSAAVLLYLGTEGWACPVQADFTGWKCFYNITVLEKYLLILGGGYVGCMFISALCMLVSAKTRSAVAAVMVPVVIIFLPSLLNVKSSLANKILGLLPDQLLQTGVTLNFFNLYSIGGKVVGAIPIMLVLYTALTALLFPAAYKVYRRRQIY